MGDVLVVVVGWFALALAVGLLLGRAIRIGHVGPLEHPADEHEVRSA